MIRISMGLRKLLDTMEEYDSVVRIKKLKPISGFKFGSRKSIKINFVDNINTLIRSI